MTKKESVFKAVNRDYQEIFPTQIDCTPDMQKKLPGLLKTEENKIEEKLGNYIKYCTFDDRIDSYKNAAVQYDIWGVGWDLILTEGFEIRHHPLLESENLKNYHFPEPSDNLIRGLAAIACPAKPGCDLSKTQDYFILFDQAWTLFERSWLLRGYEEILTDFYWREKEVNWLLDGIAEFHIEMAKRIIKKGIIDGAYTGDDFGTQKDLVMSPETWRKFFKKRYSKIWEVYKEKNIPVFHHSCGNIISIIPDLIEIGLDVLSPVQPEAMDPAKLSAKFGKHLTFFGGISTQKTLPFGSPGNVRKEIIDRIRILGRDCGYIISPSHEVTSDCRPENFLAMLQTFEDYKDGKIKMEQEK